MKIFSPLAAIALLYGAYHIHIPSTTITQTPQPQTQYNELATNPNYHNLTNDPDMNGLTDKDGVMIRGMDLIILKPAFEMSCSIKARTTDPQNPTYVECVDQKYTDWTSKLDYAINHTTQQQRDCILQKGMIDRRYVTQCKVRNRRALQIYTKDLFIAYAEIRNVETGFNQDNQ
jgi:hypothetical protein